MTKTWTRSFSAKENEKLEKRIVRMSNRQSSLCSPGYRKLLFSNLSSAACSLRTNQTQLVFVSFQFSSKFFILCSFLVLSLFYPVPGSQIVGTSQKLNKPSEIRPWIIERRARSGEGKKPLSLSPFSARFSHHVLLHDYLGVWNRLICSRVIISRKKRKSLRSWVATEQSKLFNRAIKSHATFLGRIWAKCIDKLWRLRPVS